MPLKSIPIVVWWNRERVRNGLRRLARDFFGGREADLPQSANAYREAVPLEERRRARQERRYPSHDAVLRVYESLLTAWLDLGFEIEERTSEFWTRAAVITGLQRFYKDFGFCPPSSETYLEKQQFTGKLVNGKASRRGADQKYPSVNAVLKHFASLRDAWRSAGFTVEDGQMPWSLDEDRFLVEACGILSRSEIAETMGRSEGAIKRRLYNLGKVAANSRWGLSRNRVETLLRLPAQSVDKYINQGIIPVFRGIKNVYLNPADLTKIEEFDWEKGVIDPELETMMRRSLIHRLLRILKFGENWRAQDIYKFEFNRSSRYKKVRRVANLPANTPAAPNDLATGDWIAIAAEYEAIAGNRPGVIKTLSFSWQQVQRKDGTRRACWMATVEFPVIKGVTAAGAKRLHYNLPLDVLRRAEKPQRSPIEWKMTPEAIRGRYRRATNRFSAAERLKAAQSAIA